MWVNPFEASSRRRRCDGYVRLFGPNVRFWMINRWSVLTYVYHNYLLAFCVPWSRAEDALGISRGAGQIEEAL
jgi:uncharacterized membrane protein